MKQVFAYDPENPKRENVLALLVEFIRKCERRVMVTVADPTRTLEQNARMWAMLHDIAEQVEWWENGKRTYLSAEDWKAIFTSSLRNEQRIAQGIDGGLVALGHSTRRMSVREVSDLMELMAAFGAEHNVEFKEPETKE